MEAIAVEEAAHQKATGKTKTKPVEFYDAAMAEAGMDDFYGRLLDSVDADLDDSVEETEDVMEGELERQEKEHQRIHRDPTKPRPDPRHVILDRDIIDR